MPQYVETPAPAAETDLHGSGTYQTGTAPKTLGQKAQEARQAVLTNSAARAPQNVRGYAPGMTTPGKPSIKGRTSFSDEQGD